MPQSKNRKNHSQKLNQRQKQMSNEQQNKEKEQQFEVPTVRSVPTWSPDADVIVKGYLWDQIFNGLANIQGALQAANAVMSQNVLSGVVQVDFEKLNTEGTAYVPMTVEEKQPYVDQMQAQLDALRNPAKKEEQKAVSPILNQDGLAQFSDKGKVEQPVATDEAKPKAKRGPKAKVVQGDFDAKP